MNRFLLDTHTFLWMLSQPELLGQRAIAILKNPSNHLYVSTVSFWEVAIKSSLGKLELQSHWASLFESEIALQKMNTLSVSLEHCKAVETLEFHHRDPFDRMLVAQALVEELTLLTKDEKVQQYAAPWVW